LCGLALSGCTGKSANEADACSKLKDLRLDHTEIVSAEYHSAGRQVSLMTTPIGIPWFNMPASCRVKLIIKPTADSHIESEVWMPATAWNGRLWSAGNGGLAGSIDELSMSVALMRGYATSGTDTGHQAADQDGRWGLGHPEKLIDFGYRAIHETALQAKALISALYGKPPAFSYFASGSNGGREALAEAQRFPEDYDGVESDAPAFDGSNNVIVGSWTMQQLAKTQGSWLPPAKLPAIAAAAMAACDAIDGLKDGLIDDPRRCSPQPEALLCKAEETDNCLTQAQIAAVKALYDGPGGEDPDHYGYHGYEPGSELGWGDWSLGSGPGKSILYNFSDQFHRYLVYDDATWTLDRFDIAKDAIETDRKMGAFYDARDPDLSRFAARGGKLMLFHGWSDMALQPRLTIDYYERVRTRMGAEAAANVIVLYMVPGMAHGFGGPGPNAFGQVMAPPANASASTNVGSALIAWVEKGERPGPVIAAKYDNDIKALIVPLELTASRTRPICLYPQVARWNGKGSVDEAKNFTCVPPPN
jgi:feruloyl esterase